MNFKQWLEEDGGISGVGSVANGSQPTTAGGFGQAGLSSGGGEGGGAFDNWGRTLKLKGKKKPTAPLAALDGRPRHPVPVPKDNIELTNNSQNSGGSGEFA